MSKYFNKDFFNFFLGFLALIVLSLVLIVAGKMYKDNEVKESSNSAKVLSNY